MRRGSPLKRIAAAVAVVALLCTASAGAATVPEKQAIGAAKQYLALSGFSRLGLISQLSSKVADGYPHKVAVYAVNSLHENWNAQAVRVAKQYLKLSHFSCSGMVEQLSSSVADQFTKAQAEYGAKKAHLC
jgi:Host cell surface-exposed lipoprotein